MDPRTRLALFDEHAREFITGIDAIAKAAGYGWKHFLTRHLDVPARREVVGSGVWSCHTGLGHFYEVQGRPWTHPSSGAAWGANARELAREERQARAQGWRGAKACLVSAGSALTGMAAAAASGAATGPDFKGDSSSVAL